MIVRKYENGGDFLEVWVDPKEGSIFFQISNSDDICSISLTHEDVKDLESSLYDFKQKIEPKPKQNG